VNHEHRVRRRLGASAGPGEHILAVRRDVEVVDATLERDGLDVLKRDWVDNIDAAGGGGLDLRKLRYVVTRQGDRHIKPSAIGCYIDKIGVPAERDSFGRLQSLSVENGDCVVRLFADVDSAAVRGHHNPVGRFDPLDLSYHLIGGRVDDVD